MHFIRKEFSDYLTPLIIGTVGFFAFIGPVPLNPYRVDWLGFHDFLQSFLGWEFFRLTPWGIPLGSNPSYGYDISSSIVYSDSTPLFAIFFKLFSNYLPQNFQYFGLWLLCCFLLQSVAGWKISSLYTTSLITRIFSSLFLVSSPILLWRLEMTHISLAGHFLILFAIYLNLTVHHHKSWMWGLLISTAVLIHFYLLVMVLMLWIADLLDRLSSHPVSKIGLFIESLCIFATMIFLAWQAGYFMVGFGSISDKSFGNFSMDLLAPFDSRGYSAFFGSIPQSQYFDEGFNYLGAGAFILLMTSLPAAWLLRGHLISFIWRKKYLCLTFFVLILLALTNQIRFGGLSLHFNLPDSVISFLSIIRSSGRMFWPIYYCLLLLPIILISKVYNEKIFLILLIITFYIQIYDIGPLRTKLRNNLTHPPYINMVANLKNPFWNIAGQNYKIFITRPDWQSRNNWAIFSTYALSHTMATNIVSLAKVGKHQLEEGQQNFDRSIYKNKFDSETMYLIPDWKLMPGAPKILFNKSTDALLRVDGFNILAPRWKECQRCSLLDISENELVELAPKVELNKPILFSKYYENKDLFLLDGWTIPNEWGVWAIGNSASAVFPIPQPHPRRLVIQARALVSKEYPSQHIEIWSKNYLIFKGSLTKFHNNILEIPLPNSVFLDSYLPLTIKILNPLPVDKVLPNSFDKRELAFGLISVEFK